MYLNDRDICKQALENDMICPFDPAQLQAASYDCRLDNVLIDPSSGESFFLAARPFIQPHEFLIASTKERVEIPDNLVCQVWGKSSNARQGLFIHTTAGWVDPGFEGQLTLELYNCSNEPFDLTEIDGICQLTFAQLTGQAKEAYDGHYQGQVGATRSYREYL